jgi:hypothetical protein
VLPPATTVVPGPARSRLPLVVSALVLGNLGYLLVLATKPGGIDVVVAVSDVTTVVAAAVASLACAFAGRRHASSARAFWWLLAASCGAWACGEAIWAWYELVLDTQVPSPSWADVGFLAGTPLAVAAFACHPAARARDRRGLIPLLDGVAVASALLFVSWKLVLEPFWEDTGGMSVGELVSVAYPFADVVILVLVILALRSTQAGNRPATAMLLGGLFVMAVSDTAFTYLVQVGGYSSGDLIEMGWFASYLAIAAAALVYESPVDDACSRAVHSQLTSVVAANVPILVALVVILAEESRGAHLDRVEWGIALCLTLVVLARQLLDLLSRRSAFRAQAKPSSRPVSVRRPQTGAPVDTMSELQALTLQMVAAARPSAETRVQQVSSSMVMVLTSAAGVLALWDFSLLVRAAG